MNAIRIRFAAIILAIALCAWPCFAYAEETPNSGSIGETVTWSYAPETATLTFEGEGEIPDCNNTDDVPWRQHASEATSIYLDPRIYKIGSRSFQSFHGLFPVALPENIAYVDTYAFARRSRLEMIWPPASLQKIEHAAFSDCTALTDVYFSGTKEQADAILIEGANQDLKNATWHYNESFAPFLKGDVNGNNKVNIIDAQLAHDIACRNYAPTPEMLLRARVNHADDVYAEDAFTIQQAIHNSWGAPIALCF